MPQPSISRIRDCIRSLNYQIGTLFVITVYLV